MVPFCNCLFNTNKAVFKYMLRNKDKYIKDYPYIDTHNTFDDYHQFAIESSFTYWEFLGYLREGPDTKYTFDDFMEKDSETYCDIRVNWTPMEDAISTNILFGILHLLNEGVIKFIIIYDEIIKYDTDGGKLLYSVFQKYFDDDKILLLSSGAYDVYTQVEEKTFFISPDLETLYKIGQSKNGYDYYITHLVPRGILHNYTEESKVRFNNTMYWDMKYEDYFKKQSDENKLGWAFYSLKPAIGRTTIYGQQIS